MDQSSGQSSLSRALQNQVIPWVERWGTDRFLLAAGSYRGLLARNENLPEGMEVSHRPLRGGRKAVRSARVYGSSGIVNAQWPDDNLQSTRAPKLCFILSGVISYPVADYQLVCRAGHGILLPAGVPFASVLGKESVDLPGVKRCEILQILPYQSSLNCWLSTKAVDEKGNFSNNADVSCVVRSKVPEYIKSLADEATRREQLHKAIYRSWLQLIIYELHRELRDVLIVKTRGRSQRLGAESIVHDNNEDPMLQVQKYIRRNLASGLSLNEAANYACMSRSVFTEKFRRHTGLSFTEYTTRLRIEEAQTLLNETDLSVIQVSKTIGITTARLRALFQQEFSLSPTQYRERSRQSESAR